MDYDRTKKAGQYDNRLARAKSAAKSSWGSAWDKLTPEMRQAYVCMHLVSEIANLDLASLLDSQEIAPEKMKQKLIDIGAVCDAAVQGEF